MKEFIPIDECIIGRVYKLHSRNLSFGVYVKSILDRTPTGEFIGIRHKFDKRFLDAEEHYDEGPPYGTAKPIKDVGVDVPEHIPLQKALWGNQDTKTGRYVRFDNVRKKWYFLDTGRIDEEIRPANLTNKLLFDFLDKI